MSRIGKKPVPLPKGVTESHKSLFDGTNCGLAVAGKPIIEPSMLTRRVKVADLFFGIWLLVIVAYATAWTQPSTGVMGTRGLAPAVGSVK